VDTWLHQVRVDPVPALQASSNEALQYFVRRDLLDEDVGPVEPLWDLPGALKILKKQREDGSWKYPGGKKDIRTQRGYDKLQTYKMLMDLVEKYGFTRAHLAIQDAANFLFTFQTEEGDFRGIYRNQYSPNYSAGITELLIKAGYHDDPRIDKGLSWLLSMRQDDGGWAVPARTGAPKDSDRIKDVFFAEETIQPDRSRPFSHWCTGVVLRALAAHPEYRRAPEARHAGELLKSRFFQRDKYTDRQAAYFWEKIRFPFWWTDVLSALDSLCKLGFSRNDPDIKKGLDWLIGAQEQSGLWKARYLSGGDKDIHLWTTLGVCRALKRFCG
jgi:hypothetical protein